jgi:hypothetical protein
MSGLPRGSETAGVILAETLLATITVYAFMRGFAWSLWSFWIGILALILAYFVLYGAVILVLQRISRTHGEGSCQKCGYELRASPDRCPECGTPSK